VDELYVVARRVLLDTLDVLQSHRDATILVGAHAIYLRVGEADLAVAPYTTDGDLALDPATLAERPPIELILSAAGFRPKPGAVGVWLTQRATTSHTHTEISIDLLVPAAVSPGKGRRSAKLPGHDGNAARIVRGLEGIIVDTDVMAIAALEPEDERTFGIRVAGPGALLIAKLHKIHDRAGSTRAVDKDALDVLRLLRGVQTDDIADRLTRILADDRAAPVAREAIGLLRALFGHRAAEGVQMIVRAVGELDDPDELTSSCVFLTEDLLHALA
jgi:hypothetical protein